MPTKRLHNPAAVATCRDVGRGVVVPTFLAGWKLGRGDVHLAENIGQKEGKIWGARKRDNTGRGLMAMMLCWDGGGS